MKLLFVLILNKYNMESEVKERVRMILRENKTNPTKLSKLFGLNQKTLNNQINADTQLSVSIILLILEHFPSISAEWLLRGKGEMYLQSGDAKTEDLQFLREKIIRLEAENKVLREVAGLHSGNDEVTNEKTA